MTSHVDYDMFGNISEFPDVLHVGPECLGNIEVARSSPLETIRYLSSASCWK